MYRKQKQHPKIIETLAQQMIESSTYKIESTQEAAAVKQMFSYFMSDHQKRKKKPVCMAIHRSFLVYKNKFCAGSKFGAKMIQVIYYIMFIELYT